MAAIRFRLWRAESADAGYLERRQHKGDREEGSSPELKKEARQSPTHYRARIELTETKFRNLPEGFTLRPGMRAVCDIKIGRSILEYVLNPISRVIGESLREP